MCAKSFIYNCVQVYFRCPSLQLTLAILLHTLLTKRNGPWGNNKQVNVTYNRFIFELNWLIIVVTSNDLTCLETAFYVLIKFSTLFAFVLI